MSAPASEGGEVFARFVDVMLPGGGCVMTLMEAYFDESGSHAGAAVLCLAGYLFTKDQAILFDTEWRAVLASKELPFFHMVDCAHGNGPFANLTLPERKYVAAQMIGLIKKRSILGLAATIVSEDVQNIFDTDPSDAYVFLTHALLSGISECLKANPGMEGKVAYFFEAGHKAAGRSNRVFNLLLDEEPNIKEKIRYAGHAFIEKRNSAAIQAADLLAWQWCKDRKNKIEGRPRRKDCESLLQHFHNSRHVDANYLTELAKRRGRERVGRPS